MIDEQQHWGAAPDEREQHFCTDYEICPVCWLCTGCCAGHTILTPAALAAAGAPA